MVLKKLVLSVSCAVMTFGLIGTSTSFAAEKKDNINLEASQISQLTPEQQNYADEVVTQLQAINEVLIGLDTEKQQEDFLGALYDPNFSTDQLDSNIVLAENAEEVTVLNDMFEELGSPVHFSSDVKSVIVEENGDLVATTISGENEIMALGFWGELWDDIKTVAGKTWDVAKCGAAITAVFVPGAAAYKSIKALGGVKSTVQLLAKASNTSDWLAIGGGAAAEILGIDGVKTYCF
ncbi:hypothetical protein ACFTQ7_22455 [Lysinibacillus sp. NPDC056959]|uniref:hypothetical protein n=1 Tax=Lysinibacillus sp. NPDC056959 TaxID=3345981 RepID=UPI003632A231